MKAGQNLRRPGLHCGALTTDNMLRVWKTFVLSKAMYAIHLTPLTNEIAHGWEDLEKQMTINAMGCFSEKNRARLGTIGRIMTLDQHREVRMASLKRKTVLRASTSSPNSAARKDPDKFLMVSRLLKVTGEHDKRKIWEVWRTGETRRSRKLPDTKRGRHPPALKIETSMLRRAAIQWYCGTFPVRRDNSHTQQDAEWNRNITRLKFLLGLGKWSRDQEMETMKMLQNAKREGGRRWT